MLSCFLDPPCSPYFLITLTKYQVFALVTSILIIKFPSAKQEQRVKKKPLNCNPEKKKIKHTLMIPAMEQTKTKTILQNQCWCLKMIATLFRTIIIFFHP